jgi:hypothetical protein
MDAKRAIGGFCIFMVGTVVNILQATEPNWFGNHAWILPASFVVLLVGLLFWLCQYQWAQKLLGIVQPICFPLTEPPLEARPQRLKIIEAHYGIEGINDPDVTHYLVERLCGNSYAELVGADLFHGFDPVSGKVKRLAVRYSFDGKESAVIRPENEWLILPEDMFLRKLLDVCREERRVNEIQLKSDLSRVREAYRQCDEERKTALQRNADSLSMSDSDPRVYPQFVDARMNGSDKRELQAYFTLINRSESEARNIILEPIEMNGKIIQFTRHRLAAPLLPNREVCFYPDVVTTDNKSVTDRERDLFHIFCLDYIALGDSTICEATKPVRATYQDSARNLFEVTCELVFDPSAHNDVRMGNRGPNPAIFTRNHRFRKVAIAI